MSKKFKVIKIEPKLMGPGIDQRVEDKLNEVSREGWEVVSVAYSSFGGFGTTRAHITISK